MAHRHLSAHFSCCFLLGLILLFWHVSPAQARPLNEDSEAWLRRLDDAVARRDDYNQQKRDRLSQLLSVGKGLHEPRDLYMHNSLVYEECFTFDSELAMSIVDKNIELAKQLDDPAGIAEWHIKRSFILAATGQLLESAEALSGISSSSLSRDLKLQYYAQQQYLYSHLEQFSWADGMKADYHARQGAYSDSVYAIVEPSDPNYLWYQAWKIFGEKNDQSVVEHLRAVVDTLALDCRQDAMLAYVLARFFESHGEQNLYIQYMSRSAIADLRSANQEIASLEELSAVLYNSFKEEAGKTSASFSMNEQASKSLDRAYSYIFVSLQTARTYNNQLRIVNIARVMEDILASYQQRDRNQRQRLLTITWGLTILLVLLVLASLMMWFQRRRINSNRQLLRQTNDNLKVANIELATQRTALAEANAALTDANRNLSESNYVKEEYIGYVFSLCSNYISKMDEYRKNINRKVKVRLYDEVLQMTDKQTFVADELKEFYQNFDAIFLHIYPHFVDDFNTLLMPEERIEPRKGELLNTDLRIYALVRLGITDSVKIAEFLHCSPQTVYNNRLKIRNKAIVPKEEFAKYVRELGKAEVS